MHTAAAIVAFFEQRCSIPRPWGFYHFAWLLILAAALFCLVKAEPVLRRDPRLCKKLTCGIGAFLLFIEILKQVFSGLHAEAGEVTWRYPWYIFPFQLCTTPLYVCILLLPARGIVRNSLCAYLGSFGMLGGIAVMLVPQTVFCDLLFINLHTMLWHTGLIVLGALQWVNPENRPDACSFFGGACVFLLFLAAASVLNFAFRQYAGEGFNMFYISPFVPVPTLPFIEHFRLSVPYPIYLCAYVLVLFAGAAVVFAAMHLAVRPKTVQEKIKRAGRI